jgi:lysophospholipase L1-like esterase
MKKYLLLLLSALGFMAMKEIKKTHILFFGDSITEFGARKGGYIDRIQKWIDANGKRSDIQLTGAGIGGNKIYDLYLRIEDDVLAKKPDIVFVFIGVNDVLHKARLGTGTDIDKFEKFYIAIIKKLQAQNIQVILCTPVAIGEKYNSTNGQDAELDAFSAVIRKLSNKMNCKLVDLRKSAMEYEAKNNRWNSEKGILTTDRVHLNDTGNEFVADAMMKVLGWK